MIWSIETDDFRGDYHDHNYPLIRVSSTSVRKINIVFTLMVHGLERKRGLELGMDNLEKCSKVNIMDQMDIKK